MLRPQQRSSEQKAFGGRVGFFLTYQTRAVVNLAARLKELALEGAEGLAENEVVAITDVTWALAHTTGVTFYDDSHPEIAAFADVWRWWMESTDSGAVEPAAFRAQILTVGSSTINGWYDALRANDLDSVGPLAAPKALLPDDQLSDAERNDPNSASAGSNSETISGVRSARSPNRKNSPPAST